MSILDRQDIIQQATVPDNKDQPPRFGAITECVKDAFLLELRHFFNTAYTQTRLGELPRIDKYSVAGDVSTDPLETAVSLIRSFPDIAEDMPLIAVLATTGRNSRLSISGHYTSMVVPDAKVLSSINAPTTYTLTDGMSMVLTSQPGGTVASQQTSTFIFPASMFANMSAATLDEVISVINVQALYVQAFKYVSGSVTKLGIRAGGPSATSFPNKVTIVGGTALSALGFTVGQTDQNYGQGKRAMYRHHMAADMSVSIEVVAESENVRTELTDLLYDFVSYTLADRMYTFYGRSTYDDSVQDETYQIIIKDNEISFSGEQEIPRPGDSRDKIYINRLSIPVTALMYSDRVATNKDNIVTVPVISVNSLSTPDLFLVPN